MADTNEGVLQMQPSGRWAICRICERPHEINSGDVFRIEVDGELKVTTMEFRKFTGPLDGREYRGLAEEYCSSNGFHLANGMRAAIVSISSV